MIVRVFAASVLMLTLATATIMAWQQQANINRATERPSAVDIGFVSSMTLRHEQAIVMAQLMLDGRSTSLQPVVKSLVASQLYEYGEMQGWLKLWGEPLNKKADGMDWLLQGDTPPSDELLKYHMDCRSSPDGMVGLASLEEINQLRSLEGPQRDAHFLTLMLNHHQGGLPMAKFAATESELEVVRRRAKFVALEQAKEIEQMKRTLQAMELLLASNSE